MKTINSKTIEAKTVAPAHAEPLISGLRERLELTHRDAQAAWAAKTASGLHDVVKAVQHGVRTIEVDIASVGGEEDALVLRARFAEMLRSAANAIAPRVG